MAIKRGLFSIQHNNLPYNIFREKFAPSSEKGSPISRKAPYHFILTPDEICREYCASRSREAAYFLMRLCASPYTERSVFLTSSIFCHFCIMPARMSTQASSPRLLVFRHRSNLDMSPHFQPVCVL